MDQVSHPVYGLRKGEEWNTLLETIRENYGGVFYDTGRLHIVVWFHPIEVQRAEENEIMKIAGEPFGIHEGTFVMNYHHGLLRLV